MTTIERIVEVSKEVIIDSCMDNGAIVAANTTKKHYPLTAKNYFYVWPRDASYTCVAADIIGINSIQENFFKWCMERAEFFSEKGLFFENYHINGLKASERIQPDQTGSVLYSLWHHYSDNLEKAVKFEGLIRSAAEGICNIWECDHFNIVANDIWEERLSFPDLSENFTYSLAACIKGLECANKIIPEKRWNNVAKQMRDRLEKHFIDGYFVRSYGKLVDNAIDSSLLGLIYPFDTYEVNDKRITSTVKEIEKKLVIKDGLHRYEFDEYDGWMYHGMHRKKGGGAWPLLNLWISIYYSKKGDISKAEKFYNWVLKNVTKEGYIAEQVFENEIQVSVCPLVWAHSMFIIASKHLGHI